MGLRHSDNPHNSLKEAIGGLRTLGTVFLVVGLAALYVNFIGMRVRWRQVEILVPSLSIFLFGPGALYHVAAHFVSRRETWAATLSLRTAVCQSIVAISGIAGFFVATGVFRIRFYELGPVVIPLFCTIFFVPALIAQAVSLGRAMRAIRLLPEVRQGFELIPMAKVVEEKAEEAAEEQVSEGSDRSASS